MKAKTVRRLRFELSGPGIIDKSYETAGTAISAAITAAEALGKQAGTFIVRDVTDEIVGRVGHDDEGNTATWRASFIGAGS